MTTYGGDPQHGYLLLFELLGKEELGHAQVHHELITERKEKETKRKEKKNTLKMLNPTGGLSSMCP